MRLSSVFGAVCFVVAGSAYAAPPPFWGQWGKNSLHTSFAGVPAQTGSSKQDQIVYDPFVAKEQQGPYAAGDLLVHYQTALVDGSDVFMECKTGQYANIKNWQVQTWCENKFTWVNGHLQQVWNHISDWKPVPFSPDKDGPGWEPVYHAVLTRQAIWVPGFGGSVFMLSRATGTGPQINPFGGAPDPNKFTVGPLSADGGGNIYYNVMQLDGTAKDPWVVDTPASFFVKITAAGVATVVPWSSVLPAADTEGNPIPSGTSLCNFRYDTANLPWPVLNADGSPAPVPQITCGSQRPPVNTAPAIGPDGTIYDVSRAALDDYYGYVVAINPDLTPKWAASMRQKFHDGCGTATLPPNGALGGGGCRKGLAPAFTGVSPPTGQPGDGRVLDDSTSSVVVAPDGSVFYGAYTRYNYAQGHLMHWTGAGTYIPANNDALAGFQFGWDITPGIFSTATSYAVVLKENHYGDVGSYCNDNVLCPPDRTATNPGYPEEFFISALNPDLTVKWRFKNTNTNSCSFNNQGVFTCVSDHPRNFEWCVNAPGIDSNGNVFANSEDGNLYEIDKNGVLFNTVFTNLAIGAAYTPLTIGPDGRIYTQNDGILFVIGN